MVADHDLFAAEIFQPDGSGNADGTSAEHDGIFARLRLRTAGGTETHCERLDQAGFSCRDTGGNVIDLFIQLCIGDQHILGKAAYCTGPLRVAFGKPGIGIDHHAHLNILDILANLNDLGDHLVTEFAANRDSMAGVGTVGVDRHICTANAGIKVLYDNIILSGHRHFPLLQADILLAVINRSFHSVFLQSQNQFLIVCAYDTGAAFSFC